jgi:hypothetical protein
MASAMTLPALDTLSLSDFSGKGPVKFARLASDGAPVKLKLAEEPTLTVPFAPSAFGDDAATKLSISFHAPPDLVEQLAALEEWARGKLKSTIPDVDGLWKSCVKVADGYAPALKAKIVMDRCNFYDANREPAAQPDDWRAIRCTAMVHVKGAYWQRTMVGLCLEVTDVMHTNVEAKPACPF